MDRELSPDMIFEVLTRTSLVSLDTCKTVSKRWNEMIYDSAFFPVYLEKTGMLFGFFVQGISDNTCMSQFVGVDQTGEEGRIKESWPAGDVKILASCNQGIVCCQKRIGRNCRWYVGKPATGQWKVMPNPKLRYKTVGVALIVFKSKPFRFSVIRLSERNINDEIKMEHTCEIFESTTWSWKKTQSLYLHYQETIDVYQPAITVGDFVYWKTSGGNVMAFHVTRQNFYKFPLPTHVDIERLRLVEYQGRLGCSLTQNGNMQLWLTRRGKYYGWERKMDEEIRVPEENFTNPSLVGFCHSSTSFMVEYNRAMFFNVEDYTFTNKNIDFALRYALQFFQFRSDAEHVDLKCLDKDD